MIVKMPPPTPAAPHVGPMSPLRLCPPRNIRALRWSWTVPGGVARQACPPGTTGEASWTCGLTVDPGTGAASPVWSPSSPDLSHCQSVWMEKIISELRTSDLIINLANDLMQYVSVNALYGKDITSAIDAMTIIAEKMQYQLREIPTREQREAMVMELVQSLTKIASFLLLFPGGNLSQLVLHLLRYYRHRVDGGGDVLPVQGVDRDVLHQVVGEVDDQVGGSQLADDFLHPD